MIEFTLVLPFLFFLLFGVFEFSLMMFSMGSARYAAADGARVVSEQGTVVQACSAVAGCSRLKPALYAGKDCDADCQALSAVNLGPLGTTSIATVDEIEVARLNLSGGSLTPALCPGPCSNAYMLDGTPTRTAYPAASRAVTLGTADYVAVTIRFHYDWKTGIFKGFRVPALAATYDIRLEPQRFP